MALFDVGRLEFTIIFLSFVLFSNGFVKGDSTGHLDFFHSADSSNDSSLSMTECKSMWNSLDLDHDSSIDKVELFLQWTFHGFPDASHAPLFFRLMDIDFDGRISYAEIGKLCGFFDDDEDGQISAFEFELNWNGMFNTS